MPLLTRWSANANSSSNALEAIRSLDPTQVFRTCLAFPMQLPQGEVLDTESTKHDGQIYDPMFLSLLFTAMLSDCPPSSPLAWVELFRTNIACLLIRTLSAKDGSLRTMALSNLVGVWKSLEVRSIALATFFVHVFAGC
jgi:nucleolar pre-ribosomal-associated protein 1